MRKKILAAVMAATMVSGAANAATIINGSFELGSPQPGAGSFSTLGTGSTAITGWSVFSGSIDWINGYWQAADGTHSVDLSGNGNGAIEQTFARVAGVRTTERTAEASVIQTRTASPRHHCARTRSWSTRCRCRNRCSGWSRAWPRRGGCMRWPITG